MVVDEIGRQAQALAAALNPHSRMVPYSGKLTAFRLGIYPRDRWFTSVLSDGREPVFWECESTFTVSRTTIATDSPTPRVQFVKNQRLQLEPFKSSGPNEWWDAISYHAESVSSGKHLMAYLEYQTADMAVFIRPTRMQLRDSQNFLRNGDLTLSVIMREERPDGQFNFIFFDNWRNYYEYRRAWWQVHSISQLYYRRKPRVFLHNRKPTTLSTS
jgi:hypothetical protein